MVCSSLGKYHYLTFLVEIVPTVGKSALFYVVSTLPSLIFGQLRSSAIVLFKIQTPTLSTEAAPHV